MELWFTLAAILLVLTLFLYTQWPPDLILGCGVGLLLASGVLTMGQATKGFANEGVLTIAVLFVVASGLERSGGIAWATRYILGRPKTEAGARLRLLLPVVALSGFINNTPLVAMLIPAVSDWCRRQGFQGSRFLLPLSYAALLGGMCTLIGTSTNLVVSGLALERGLPPISMFEVSRVGLPCALVGLVYLVWLAPRFLPKRVAPSEERGRSYQVRLELGAECPWVGWLPEATLFAPHYSSQTPLETGQVLTLDLSPEVLQSLLEVSGVTLQGVQPKGPWVEVSLGAECPFLGDSWDPKDFFARYGLLPLGYPDQPQRGDCLLASVPATGNKEHKFEVFVVAEHQVVLRRLDRNAWTSLGLMGLMVVLAAGGFLSMLQAALVTAGLMLALRCLDLNLARLSIDWPILIAIALSFALSEAIQTTGLDQILAEAVLQVGDGSPVLGLLVIFLVTSFLTELLTNNAAAVLMFPIGLSVAEMAQVNSTAFLFAVMLAASTSFASPMGYQTNLMVYGPGGYRFGDYLKLGLPLKFLTAAVPTLLLLWPYPF